MREAHRRPTGLTQLRQEPGQLPAAPGVEGLEDPPVPAGWEEQFILRDAGREVASERLEGQVLVDDDQPESVVGVGRVGQQRVAIRHGVQSRLELLFKVPIRQATEQFPVRRRQSGVSRPAAAPALLIKLLAYRHMPIIPQPPPGHPPSAAASGKAWSSHVVTETLPPRRIQRSGREWEPDLIPRTPALWSSHARGHRDSWRGQARRRYG